MDAAGEVNGVKRKRADTEQTKIDVNVKTSRADFEAVFPALVKDIADHSSQFNIPKPALEWLLRVSQEMNLPRSSHVHWF